MELTKEKYSNLNNVYSEINVKNKELYTIILISLHGRVSNSNMELGIDLDTGGQVKYVVELTKALSKHAHVKHIYLLTRLILDNSINKVYHQQREIINEKATIIRLPCGPISKYLKKEDLWPYIWEYVDESYKFLKLNKIKPFLIHGHYAESCEISTYLSNMINVPCVITGHSLGRNKLDMLIKNNITIAEINKLYNMNRRIEAEEKALENTEIIFNSTMHEAYNQWSNYDFKINKDIIKILAPGVEPLNNNNFIKSGIIKPKIIETIEKFYYNTNKPVILLLTRPSKKKNIESSIEAFSNSDYLKENCNLLLVMGNRNDTSKLDHDSKDVLTSVLLLIDKYNLYGKVAYPKNHDKNDIPFIYEYVKNKKGVFINSAYIEPFGLTLIEASYYGIPVVATNQGGPKEIINNLKNGLLIDPTSIQDISDKLEKIIKDKKLYNNFSEEALKNVHHFYSWDKYADKYIKIIRNIKYPKFNNFGDDQPNISKLNKKFLFSDIDNTLLGNDNAYDLCMSLIGSSCNTIPCLTSGRDFNSIENIINKTKFGLKNFKIIICSVGTEVYIKDEITKEFILDENHSTYIDYKWDPNKIKEILNTIDILKEQTHSGSQSYFKLSYDIIINNFNLDNIKSLLRKEGITCNLIQSHELFLDIIPIRASKGRTLRYLINKYELPFNNIVVAGDSGNDEDMMTGKIKSIVVANYSEELEPLRERNNVYFSNKTYASGVLDGLEHYGFI
jgi:sucrose-phosphate synthase